MYEDILKAYQYSAINHFRWIYRH